MMRGWRGRRQDGKNIGGGEGAKRTAEGSQQEPRVAERLSLPSRAVDQPRGTTEPFDCTFSLVPLGLLGLEPAG